MYFALSIGDQVFDVEYSITAHVVIHTRSQLCTNKEQVWSVTNEVERDSFPQTRDFDVSSSWQAGNVQDLVFARRCSVLDVWIEG